MLPAVPSDDSDGFRDEFIDTASFFPHRRFRISLTRLLWIVTCVVLLLTLAVQYRDKRASDRIIADLRQQLYLDAVSRTDYGNITLFRIEDEYYALRMTRSANASASQIDYQWVKLPAKDSITASTDWSELYENQRGDDRGSGFVDESANAVSIHVGPILIQWSWGNTESGWLYFNDPTTEDSWPPAKFDVYRQQLGHISGVHQLRKWLWKSFSIQR